MIEKIIETLFEAKNQIEFFHWKFKETGSGNNVITKIKVLLDDLKEKEDIVLELKNKLEECENSKSKILKKEKDKIVGGMKEITKLLLSGERLHAIKIFKDITGESLTISKREIDEFTIILDNVLRNINN